MHDSTLNLRPFADDEVDEAMSLLSLVFAEDFTSGDTDAERLVVEPARSQAVFDGGTMVACLGTYSHRLSVPGGEIDCGGTTWVGVSPTHRRRGLLRRMMHAHLAEVHGRGEPIAALWASETQIYGRFGFGLASEGLSVRLESGDGLTFADTAAPAADRIRFVDLDEAPSVLDPIHHAAMRRRGGLHRRHDGWWRFQVLSTRPAAMQGAAWKRVAVAEIDGRDAAYAVYGTKDGFTDAGRPDVQLKVIEMGGVDAAAEAAMWRFLAGHDLVTTVVAPRRPVDDALPLLLADNRRARRQTHDGLYVRIIDLPAAFAARGYAHSAGVTIEVNDPQFAHNEGTWRLEVAPEGASVTPTDEPADLVMGVREVGSMFLGGIGVGRLAAAGGIQVHDPAAIAALDAALRPTEAPWSPEVW